MWGSAPTAAAAARAGSSAIKVASSAAAVKRSGKAPRRRRAEGATVKEEVQWLDWAITTNKVNALELPKRLVEKKEGETTHPIY